MIVRWTRFSAPPFFRQRYGCNLALGRKLRPRSHRAQQWPRARASSMATRGGSAGAAHASAARLSRKCAPGSRAHARPGVPYRQPLSRETSPPCRGARWNGYTPFRRKWHRSVGLKPTTPQLCRRSQHGAIGLRADRGEHVTRRPPPLPSLTMSRRACAPDSTDCASCLDPCTRNGRGHGLAEHVAGPRGAQNVRPNVAFNRGSMAGEDRRSPSSSPGRRVRDDVLDGRCRRPPSGPTRMLCVGHAAPHGATRCARGSSVFPRLDSVVGGDKTRRRACASANADAVKARPSEMASTGRR